MINKRNLLIAISCFVLVVGMFTGCGKKEKAVEETTTAESTTTEATTTTEAQKTLYEKMAGEYTFTSGTGGWATQMTINSDGSFTGSYSDSDMGDTGTEYPNGVVYYSNFSGQLGEPTRVNSYTYETKVENLSTDEQVGEETIKDKIKYIASSPYGLDDVDTVQIYTPGAPTSKLPENYLSWCMSASEFMESTPSELPFYGIYNVSGEEGWFSEVK